MLGNARTKSEMRTFMIHDDCAQFVPTFDFRKHFRQRVNHLDVNDIPFGARKPHTLQLSVALNPRFDR
jgi:hypothetical protein